MTVGHYILLHELGKGGMGKVFLAQHMHTQRHVVIKLLLPEYAQNEMLVQRFYAEARILAELDHPAIVRLYDFAIENGTPYLVMEYVRGTSLESILEEQGPNPLGLAWAYEYLKPIFQALSYIHAKDIVHRDIKPSNIMILPDGGAKLLDFGIAKALDADYKLTQTGTQVGTVLYMAPEQIQGAKVTPATDLYAMGLILYQCAFGCYPWEWQGKTLFQIYQMLLAEPPPIPAYAPSSQVAFFQRALAKSPMDRFLSAEAMLEALHDLVRTKSTPTPPSPTQSPSPETEKAPSKVAEEIKQAVSSATVSSSPVIPAIILIGGALLAAFVGHTSLGTLGLLLWSGGTAALLYLVLFRRHKFLTWASGIAIGISAVALIYIYGFARPRLQKAYQIQAEIYDALTAEIERYKADRLPTLIRKELARRGIKPTQLTIEVDPLPVPPSLAEAASLSPSQLFGGEAPQVYATEGGIEIPCSYSFTHLQSDLYFRIVPCKVPCGFFGLRTCEGKKKVWFRGTWQEKCSGSGDLQITYSYEPEDGRLRTEIRFNISIRLEECQRIPGSLQEHIEFEDRCEY